MNGLLHHSHELTKQLIDALLYYRPRCEVVICPPAPLYVSLASLIAQSPIRLGGQDCHFMSHGSYTGDISANMLRDAGCHYVILGHSERRTYHHETNEAIRSKVSAAHSAGLTAIVCIGETRQEQEEGRTTQVLINQLVHSLPDSASPLNTVIAYEPVWAIGTGKIPSLASIEDTHRHIHGFLTDRCRFEKSYTVLYGGSVKPENAAEILDISTVQGLLVGGASLAFHDFWEIILAASIREPIRSG